MSKIQTLPNSAPAPGDVIYVNRGAYKHYGVYAGEGRVVHFAPLAGAEISAENAACIGGHIKKAGRKPAQEKNMKKNIQELEIGNELCNVKINGSFVAGRWVVTHVDKAAINSLTDTASDPVRVATTTLSINKRNYGIYATSKKAVLYYDTDGSVINAAKSAIKIREI
jgi:hypothetical protein